jgi:tetratricopeptide (TPR) repeat protein
LGGKQPPDELSKNLKMETDGTPFFVIEAVRALISDGTLYIDRGVWILKHGPKSSIPHSVVELVSRRLETLDTDSLRFIEYGAVLGRRFSQSLLESGFRMPPSQINEIIKHLIDLNIFVKSEESELMFQHSKTQEVIYSGMSERWKRVLHKNAGQTIEILNKDNLDDTLFNLAYHFSRTLEYEKGIDYCISAGYKARNNLAPRESAQFIERAVELIDTYEKEDDRYLELNEVLGELYELDGNYPKALSIFDKVLEFSDENVYRSNILMLKGRVLQSQSKYDEAIESYQKGIVLAEEVGSSLLKAKINGYMGKIYLRKGEYDMALELQRIYLSESQKVGENRDIGQAYMNLGGVYYHLNDYNLAIANWQKARDYFEMIDYTQGIAFVNDNLGVGHLWLGKFEEAKNYYKCAEELMSKIGDAKGLSMVLNNMGVLLDDIGDYEKSLEIYRRSLQIKKRIGDIVGAANIYNNIGSAYFNMGQYEKAIDNYNENLNLMRNSKDIWGIAQALNNLAEAEIELKRLNAASKHCLESFDLAQKHTFKEILADVYRLMGILASYDQNNSKSDDFIKLSLAFANEIEEPQKIGMAHFMYARILKRRGDIEFSIDNYASALKIFEKANMKAMYKKVSQEMQLLVDKT